MLMIYYAEGGIDNRNWSNTASCITVLTPHGLPYRLYINQNINNFCRSNAEKFTRFDDLAAADNKHQRMTIMQNVPRPWREVKNGSQCVAHSDDICDARILLVSRKARRKIADQTPIVDQCW